MNRISLIISFLSIMLIQINGQKTIKIGNQIWMAENLNVNIEGSYNFNGETQNGERYGKLYTYESALKACPAGWHLPSASEWETLIKALGGEEVAGKALAEGGQSGFNARYGGYSNGSSFWFLGTFVGFWSSTTYDDQHAWYFFITKDKPMITKSYFNKNYLFSVRCVKNQ